MINKKTQTIKEVIIKANKLMAEIDEYKSAISRKSDMSFFQKYIFRRGKRFLAYNEEMKSRIENILKLWEEYYAMEIPHDVYLKYQEWIDISMEYFNSFNQLILIQKEALEISKLGFWQQMKNTKKLIELQDQYETLKKESNMKAHLYREAIGK